MAAINETVRGQDIKYADLSKSRKQALAADPKKKLIEENLTILDWLTPIFNKAVKSAEGNPRNFGVLRFKVKTPEEANKILDKSFRNNLIRWLQAGKPGTFVDFFRDRWAPIGAVNDPKKLNKNWNNNVRASLLKQLGEKEYNRWENMQLSGITPQGGAYAV